jgi:hypothetical protein
MTGHADGDRLLPGRLGQFIRLSNGASNSKPWLFSLSPLSYTFVKFKAREKWGRKSGARRHGIKRLAGQRPVASRAIGSRSLGPPDESLPFGVTRERHLSDRSAARCCASQSVCPPGSIRLRSHSGEGYKRRGCTRPGNRSRGFSAQPPIPDAVPSHCWRVAQKQ